MKKCDKWILYTFYILLIFGLLMIYSASSVVALFKYNNEYYYVIKQAIYTIIGIILSLLIVNSDISKLKNYSNIIFIISIILLILVLIPGIGIVRGGARSWIGFGNLTIQPSEIMKISIVIFLSKVLSNLKDELLKFKNFLFLLIIIISIFLIIMLQPDFGTGIVIVLSSFLLLFISNTKIKYFIFLIVMGVIGIIGLIIIAPYRMERITAFLDPWSDPLGSGFQGIQSLFAIAPSGIFGLGFNNSIQKHFFLPEPQNDFIFAIICEELGLIGGLFTISCFLIIIIRSIRIALLTKDLFKKYLVLGLTFVLFSQTFINIGVVIGLLPVTGITLPFISVGGTSLLIAVIQVSLILNISKEVDKT